MKNKVLETLERKIVELDLVLSLQKSETKESILEDLYKNENEIGAQISILRYLLS